MKCQNVWSSWLCIWFHSCPQRGSCRRQVQYWTLLTLSFGSSLAEMLQHVVSPQLIILVEESEDIGFEADTTFIFYMTLILLIHKVKYFYIPFLFLTETVKMNKPVYKCLSWKELLCSINMPCKGVEKAQNICFSKHEKLVISYGKREGRKQFLYSPSERLTCCPTMFTMHLFILLKMLFRESDMNISVALPPKTMFLFFPPN